MHLNVCVSIRCALGFRCNIIGTWNPVQLAISSRRPYVEQSANVDVSCSIGHKTNTTRVHLLPPPPPL